MQGKGHPRGPDRLSVPAKPAGRCQKQKKAGYPAFQCCGVFSGERRRATTPIRPRPASSIA